MLEKIRNLIEDYDSLVQYPHGNEHCILPEHYDELASKMLILFKDKLIESTQSNCEHNNTSYSKIYDCDYCLDCGTPL